MYLNMQWAGGCTPRLYADTPLGQTPNRQTPPEIATEAGGANPTGMHSCCVKFLVDPIAKIGVQGLEKWEKNTGKPGESYQSGEFYQSEKLGTVLLICFNFVCEQHHRSALNPFLNGQKNIFDSKCKQGQNRP